MTIARDFGQWLIRFNNATKILGIRSFHTRALCHTDRRWCIHIFNIILYCCFVFSQDFHMKYFSVQILSERPLNCRGHGQIVPLPERRPWVYIIYYTVYTVYTHYNIICVRVSRGCNVWILYSKRSYNLLLCTYHDRNNMVLDLPRGFNSLKWCGVIEVASYY